MTCPFDTPLPAQAVFPAQLQRIAIAARQILLELLRQRVFHDGADDVDHFLCRQVIGARQHRYGSGLLIIGAVPFPQRVHLPLAFRPELDPRKGVDAVVDAAVHRDKTAEHLGVGRVHNGVHGKPCDISLPEREYVRKGQLDSVCFRKRRDVCQLNDASLFCSFRQVFILDQKRPLRRFPRHPDVHQGAQNPSLALGVVRDGQIAVFRTLRFEIADQLIQPLVLCALPCHVHMLPIG